ncbi:hypothetical protein [Umezawaea sp. Da 62-37]|uniref:hypothetical protein n=1 Tax=Umezawaea sp. Da 62-37 TaxID=3075927 RepID=UPI0028F73B69|nr:hypothetical protein [Umezawaea sp. Da 62-37]WNV82027.1 hypothetical protein RM788_27845 [Umezawaea sp. Da 62-37]
MPPPSWTTSLELPPSTTPFVLPTTTVPPTKSGMRVDLVPGRGLGEVVGGPRGVPGEDFEVTVAVSGPDERTGVGRGTLIVDLPEHLALGGCRGDEWSCADNLSSVACGLLGSFGPDEPWPELVITFRKLPDAGDRTEVVHVRTLWPGTAFAELPIRYAG